MNVCYGLSLPGKLWVMGYEGIMGYVGDFPASQLGRWDFLWVMGGYGLREVWVIRVSTVPPFPHGFSASKGYGLWGIRGFWVMGSISPYPDSGKP